MTPQFILKPRIPGQDAGRIHQVGGVNYVLWARCELCRCSGPLDGFVELVKSAEVAVVCKHDWCFGNAFVRYQLELDGWARL